MRRIFRRARTERRMVKLRGKGWREVKVVILGAWTWPDQKPCATAFGASSSNRKASVSTATRRVGYLGKRLEIPAGWRRANIWFADATAGETPSKTSQWPVWNATAAETIGLRISG